MPHPFRATEWSRYLLLKVDILSKATKMVPRHVSGRQQQQQQKQIKSASKTGMMMVVMTHIDPTETLHFNISYGFMDPKVSGHRDALLHRFFRVKVIPLGDGCQPSLQKSIMVWSIARTSSWRSISPGISALVATRWGRHALPQVRPLCEGITFCGVWGGRKHTMMTD